MPPGLVALLESRIGALPGPVSDVIDALAVGEPLELAALTRIIVRPRSKRPMPEASSRSNRSVAEWSCVWPIRSMLRYVAGVRR